METISDRIKEILDRMDGPERGRQTRLAATAGCSKGLINQLLKNPGQQLGHEYAKNIEEALGWRVDWILYGRLPKHTNEERRAKRGEAAFGVIETAELIAILARRNDKDRFAILDYARDIDRLRSVGAGSGSTGNN